MLTGLHFLHENLRKTLCLSTEQKLSSHSHRCIDTHSCSLVSILVKGENGTMDYLDFSCLSFRC